MDGSKKMNISDLQMKPQDDINWEILDTFFNVDAPTALGAPLILTQLIRDGNLLAYPGMDSAIVTTYLSGMASDTTILSTELRALREEYYINKKKYQGNYNEDSHMYSLTTAFAMQEWLTTYEDTLGKSFNDLIDYINGVVPTANQIQFQ